MNEAYKKGSARVGCLSCPMGGGKAGFVEQRNYSNAVNDYLNIVKRFNGRKRVNIDEYIMAGGWSARKNGRDLANNPNHCVERYENGFLTIDVYDPASNWEEWIKTLELPDGSYSVKRTRTGYTARLREDITKQNPLLGRLFRQVFRKTAYCKGCKVCEANCVNGSLKFQDNRVKIDDCTQCQRCHEIDCGCLRYHSLRHPQGGGTQLKTLNTMSNHAPKTEWLADFFNRKGEFFIENSLNKKNQLGPFRRFLKDAGLIDQNSHITPLVGLASPLRWDSDIFQGIVLLNLVAENPQVKWYVENLEIGRYYPKKNVIQMLVASGVEPSKAGKYDAHDSICYAFKG